MMMTSNDLAGLRTELAALRKQQVQSRFGPTPASVPRLEQLLAAATSDEDRRVLYTLLASECSRARNDSLYIDCLRRCVKDLPTDPIAHADLAITLAIVEPSSRDEALSIAINAICISKSENRLVKYCATNMVRIGLMLNDYATINLALKELVAAADNDLQEDTNYEFDFVDQFDLQRVDAQLLTQYKELK